MCVIENTIYLQPNQKNTPTRCNPSNRSIPINVVRFDDPNADMIAGKILMFEPRHMIYHNLTF